MYNIILLAYMTDFHNLSVSGWSLQLHCLNLTCAPHSLSKIAQTQHILCWCPLLPRSLLKYLTLCSLWFWYPMLALHVKSPKDAQHAKCLFFFFKKVLIDDTTTIALISLSISYKGIVKTSFNFGLYDLLYNFFYFIY